MNKYPKCFPDNFEDDILPKEAKNEDKHVYRVIKSGLLDRDSFISTYEEIQKGYMPPPKRKLDLNDPGTYSTSCYIEYSEAAYWLKVFMRHYPKPCVAEGITERSCDPCQLTSEREVRQDTHVDWWIYDESKPHQYFKEVSKDDK